MALTLGVPLDLRFVPFIGRIFFDVRERRQLRDMGCHTIYRLRVHEAMNPALFPWFLGHEKLSSHLPLHPHLSPILQHRPRTVRISDRGFVPVEPAFPSGGCTADVTSLRRLVRTESVQFFPPSRVQHGTFRGRHFRTIATTHARFQK